MEAKDWLKEGNNWLRKKDYSQALGCYDKAIELNPDNAATYNNKGIALRNLKKYQEAITCYDKAIELKLDYEAAYINKGVALSDLGNHSDAITCYDKAIELKLNYAEAYYNKGNALSNLGNYQEAIMCYDKATELKSEYDAAAYNNKGNALSDLGNYQEAITCYDKAIELKPDYAGALNNKKILLQIVEEKKQDKDFPKEILPLYDFDFFDEATNGVLNKEPYKKIYTLSLKIQKELQIKGDEREMNVAHYTSKKVAQILFFDKEKDEDKSKEKYKKPIPFQLSSVTNSNDTQEGKTLFNYLFDNQKTPLQSEQFVAFVGCFMFNYDNLNQFRLYGKEDQKEGTGISIVMNPDFFCSSDKLPFHQSSEQISEGDKFPLFRCIYIDPDTNQVVSVGHRDYHTFYKVKDILYNGKNKEKRIEEIKKDITKYKDKIDKKIKNVTGLLEKLKVEIKDKNLNREAVCNLLLNLRYLVKHVAFKEEQECRIVKIPLKSEENRPIDEDEKHQRFYLNYLPLKNCVSKVYFGPKASGLELFQSLLTYQEGFKNVVCYRSTSPLA